MFSPGIGLFNQGYYHRFSYNFIVMIVSWWMLLTLLSRLIHCYENLSRRRTTTLSQSSTYGDHNASRANDGDRRTTEKYCAHTDPTSIDTRAWFQVDLGKPSNIKSVKIYYRREGYEWQQYRFRQFYLDVSDSPATSTTTSQRTRCYTDNTTAPDLPPNIIEIPCKHTTRYVIVETKYIFQIYTGPVLEICEIEVYAVTCSQNCIDMQCDEYGNCSRGCNDGYWGNKCLNVCQSTCLIKVCNMNSGICSSCNDGYYGPFCNMSCSENCAQSSCSQNGSCIGGCKPDWAGNRCDVTQLSAEDNNSNCNLTSSALYAVIAVLFISIFLNIFLIVRNVRQTKHKRKKSDEVHKPQDPIQDLNTTTYDSVEDNAGYQELGQPSQPSNYDHLK